MKRTITFALIALMFFGLFTGCGAYRRTAVVTPESGVTDGTRVTRGGAPHHRRDGIANNGRVTRGHHRDGHHMTRGHHVTRGHHYRHDGLVNHTDGTLGNGLYGSRMDNHTAARRATDGMGSNSIGDLGVQNARRGVNAVVPGP